MAICWKISEFRSSLVVTQAFHISYPVEQAACKYQQIFSICGSAADTGVEDRTPSFIVTQWRVPFCNLPESCWHFLTLWTLLISLRALFFLPASSSSPSPAAAKAKPRGPIQRLSSLRSNQPSTFLCNSPFKLYNHDSVVFIIKVQIMFQLINLHCWY